MSKKATASDAQLILQLYDLRREAEMRKARNWWIGDFWPQSADDFLKVAFAMGTQENNWLRQVSGYWSMAASFVLQGALNQELFLQPAVSGEMFIVFAKVQPFLKELREKAADPQAEGRAICVDLIKEYAEIPGVSGAHIMAPLNDRALPPVIEQLRRSGM